MNKRKSNDNNIENIEKRLKHHQQQQNDLEHAEAYRQFKLLPSDQQRQTIDNYLVVKFFFYIARRRITG